MGRHRYRGAGQKLVAGSGHADLDGEQSAVGRGGVGYLHDGPPEGPAVALHADLVPGPQGIPHRLGDGEGDGHGVLIADGEGRVAGSGHAVPLHGNRRDHAVDGRDQAIIGQSLPGRFHPYAGGVDLGVEHGLGLVLQLSLGQHRRFLGQSQVLLVGADGGQILLDGRLVLVDTGFALGDGRVDAGNAGADGGGIAGQVIIGGGGVVIGALQQGDAGFADVGHGQALGGQSLIDIGRRFRIHQRQQAQGDLVGDAVGLQLGAHGQSGIILGLGGGHGGLGLSDAVRQLAALAFQLLLLSLQILDLGRELVHGVPGVVDLLIIVVDAVLQLGDAGCRRHLLHVPAGAGGLPGGGHGGIIAGSGGFQLQAGGGVVDLSQLLAGSDPVPHLHVDVGDLTRDQGRDAHVLAGGDGADKAALQGQGPLLRQSHLHRDLLLHGRGVLPAGGQKPRQQQDQQQTKRFYDLFSPIFHGKTSY